MNCHLSEVIPCWDIISLFLGALLSAIATIVLIKLFRPKICIETPEIVGNYIKINVVNKRKCSTAINLKIEAAVVIDNYTYHLDFDRFDFLMLEKNSNLGNETPNERYFIAYQVNDFALQLLNNNNFTIRDLLNNIEGNENSYLRVRVHANHGFTGFGKTFKKSFILNNSIFFPL